MFSLQRNGYPGKHHTVYTRTITSWTTINNSYFILKIRSVEMSRILKLLPPEQDFGEEYKELHFP